jgi:hypothetical protein
MPGLNRFGGRPADSRDPYFDGRIEGTLGALASVGLLSAEEEARWRERLAASQSEPVPAAVGTRLRDCGDALLAELLAGVRSDSGWEDPAWDLFNGALDALVGVGAVDRDEWDRRWRVALGRPSIEEERELGRRLNAGGTEQDLRAIIPGPLGSVSGAGVLYALLFADGISLHLWRDPDVAQDDDDLIDFWDRVELRDDRGTFYMPGGSGGSERDYHMSFRTAPPVDATWIEVVLGSEGYVRLML